MYIYTIAYTPGQLANNFIFSIQRRDRQTDRSTYKKVIVTAIVMVLLLRMIMVMMVLLFQGPDIM
jgi:hypothetical protein